MQYKCCRDISNSGRRKICNRYRKGKKIHYSPQLRLAALETVEVSQAAAKQRKGRAGRTQDGWCYRLYLEDYFNNTMKEFAETAIKQAPVESLLLITLETCGTMNDLDLMDPPSDMAVRTAQERLVNLGFIEEDSCKHSFRVTSDGKLALSMPEIELESVRMLIAARELDCVDRALKLSGLLSVSGDLFARRRHSMDNSDMIHTFGDHLTILNLFEKFEELVNNLQSGDQSVEKWCEQFGLQYQILLDARRAMITVYNTLKRNKMLGAVQKPENEMITKMNRDERLVRALIAGYFQNTTYLLDSSNRRNGSFVLTPVSVDLEDGKERELAPECDNNETKRKRIDVMVLDESVVAKQDTAIKLGMFHTLVKRGRYIFMHIASRVEPQWILEYAPDRWRESVQFKVNEDGSVQTIIQEKAIRGVGPAVMNRFGHKCRDVENKTNTKNKLNTNQGIITCVGLFSNVECALLDLKSSVRNFRKKILKEKLNTLYDDKISDAEIRSCRDEVEGMTIFLFKIPSIFEETNKAEVTSHDLLGINKDSILGNNSENICNFYIKIRSISAARRFLCLLRKILPNHSKSMKLDQEIKIHAKHMSDLYISTLEEIAHKFGLEIKKKGSRQRQNIKETTSLCPRDTHRRGHEAILRDNLQNTSSDVGEDLKELFGALQKPLPQSLLFLSYSIQDEKILPFWAKGIIKKSQELENRLCRITYNERHLRFEIHGHQISRIEGFSFVSQQIQTAEKILFEKKLKKMLAKDLQNFMTGLAKLRASSKLVSITVDMKFQGQYSKDVFSYYKPMQSIAKIRSFDENAGNNAYLDVKNMLSCEEFDINDSTEDEDLEETRNYENDIGPLCRNTVDFESNNIALNESRIDTEKLFCNHCLRQVDAKPRGKKRTVSFLQFALCGCYFCHPCFEEMVTVQLKHLVKKECESKSVRCLRCPEQEGLLILLSDCAQISKELQNKFCRGAKEIHWNNCALAENWWMNYCEECNTPIRIPILNKGSGKMYCCPEKGVQTVYIAYSVARDYLIDGSMLSITVWIEKMLRYRIYHYTKNIDLSIQYYMQKKLCDI